MTHLKLGDFVIYNKDPSKLLEIVSLKDLNSGETFTIKCRDLDGVEESYYYLYLDKITEIRYNIHKFNKHDRGGNCWCLPILSKIYLIHRNYVWDYNGPDNILLMDKV